MQAQLVTHSPLPREHAYIELLGGELRLSHELILSCVYPRAGDVVVAAGSLIEGVGNRFSDVDVYVFTEQLRLGREISLEAHHRVVDVNKEIMRQGMGEREVLVIHTVVPGRGTKIDVEFRSLDVVDDLAAWMRELFSYAAANLVLFTKPMDSRRTTLVHRMFNAIPVLNAAGHKALLEKLDHRKLRYLLYRTRASDFSVLLDLIGAWDAAESVRAADIARRNLITQTQAYLNLCGWTFTREKWTYSYLQRQDPGLAGAFESLIMMAGCGTDSGRRQYVLETLDFVDEIFARCAALLEGCEIYPSGRRALELLERDGNDNNAHTDYANCEYAYRAKVYGRPGTPTREYLLRGLSAVG
jgi:hypothetical protein